MDPTKTHSYRRWRNKLFVKGFSGNLLGPDASYKSFYPDAVKSEKNVKKSRVYSEEQEQEIQKLLKSVEREYRKAEFFRKNKVAEIKALVKKGMYRVPGKLVVDKWFPE